MYKDINVNGVTWKKYPNEIVRNKHNMLELNFNLSDTVLSGSGDSIEPMEEVLPRFQLKLDELKVKKDAFETEMLDEDIKNIFTETNTDILSYMYSVIYETIENVALTNEEWTQKQKETDVLTQVA